MKLFILPALLALSACANQQGIAYAAAIPAYQSAAQAILDRNAAKPMTPAQIAAIKLADTRAFDALVTINDEQMRKARELHLLVQGL